MSLTSCIKKYGTAALRQHAMNREEAIFLATELLRSAGLVTEEYYATILANLREHGPYFVLVPGFAMPHAQPGACVLKIGYSLITLDEPVFFGHRENDPVDVLVCIAAPDRNSLNEEAIVEVMSLIDSDETLDRLRTAEDGGALLAFLDELTMENGD